MRKPVLAIALGFATFSFFALSVLWLHTTHKSTWQLEQAGPIPIAASYLYYGKPLGVIDGGLWDYMFSRAVANQPEDLDAVLVRASQRDTPTKPDLPTSIDGSGFGFARFAISALFLLGPRSLSLVIGFLAVLFFSTALFCLRYRDGRLLVVPIFYCALTLLLLTPFATFQGHINQAPIGGYRFFVIAGILPATHVILELFDREPLSKRNAILLILQLSIIMLAASVRLSATYFLLAVVGAALISFAIGPRRQATIKIATLLLAFAVTYGLGRATIPDDYLALGLTSDPPWHRAIVGLEFHPDWPFGDLSKRIDCGPGIPRGLSEGSDRIGHCFYYNEIKKGSPPVQVYSAGYELMMRRAFLQIVQDYPRQTLEVYLIYKPLLIWNTLLSAKLALSDNLIVLAAAAQLFILLASVLILGTAHWIVIVAAFVLIVVTSTIPQLIAWSALHTAPDLICYKFLISLLLLTALVGLVRAKVMLLVRQQS